MPQTKLQKRKKAEEMAEANAKLSPQQKLAKLDAKLGKGVGAVKERARLNKQIEDSKAKIVSPSLDSKEAANPGKLSKKEKQTKRAAKDAEIVETVSKKRKGEKAAA